MTPAERAKQIIKSAGPGFFHALFFIGLKWISDTCERIEKERALCRWEDDGGPPAREDD